MKKILKFLTALFCFMIISNKTFIGMQGNENRENIYKEMVLDLYDSGLEDNEAEAVRNTINNMSYAEKRVLKKINKTMINHHQLQTENQKKNENIELLQNKINQHRTRDKNLIKNLLIAGCYAGLSTYLYYYFPKILQWITGISIGSLIYYIKLINRNLRRNV
jgi:hypothetical protein